MSGVSNRTTAILAAAIAVALMASSLRAAERVHAGEWQFTMTHADKSDSRTFRHCVSADEAGSVNGDTQSARAYAEKKAGTRCKVTDYKVEGNAVSYAIVCGDVAIRSTTTYHGDTSEGDLFTKRPGLPEDVAHVQAKRLGDCP